MALSAAVRKTPSVTESRAPVICSLAARMAPTRVAIVLPIWSASPDAPLAASAAAFVSLVARVWVT